MIAIFLIAGTELAPRCIHYSSETVQGVNQDSADSNALTRFTCFGINHIIDIASWPVPVQKEK